MNKMKKVAHIYTMERTIRRTGPINRTPTEGPSFVSQKMELWRWGYDAESYGKWVNDVGSTAVLCCNC